MLLQQHIHQTSQLGLVDLQTPWDFAALIVILPWGYVSLGLFVAELGFFLTEDAGRVVDPSWPSCRLSALSLQAVTTLLIGHIISDSNWGHGA